MTTTEKRTYRGEHQGVPFEVTTKRAIRWFTLARWADEDAIGWIGTSTGDSYEKATKAARSTAPYAVEWHAVPAAATTP